MKHYHVLCGLRGMFMPDTNDVYRSKRAAMSGAAWWANSYREDGYTVDGAAKRGFYTIKSEHESSPSQSIEITSCTMDCLDHDNDY